MSAAAKLCAALALGALALLPCGARAAGPVGGLDARAWELVSPVDKNGGEPGAPGTRAAGVDQAAAQGGALAFGSASSFGEAEGALPVNQYLATRSPTAWSTLNLTPPALSGTYEGGAYELFSADLQSAVLSGGDRCRDGSASCEAENPPLGPGGPSGYRNLYLREGATYTPLITTTNFPALPAAPEDFQLAFEGAGPDLRHVVFASGGVLYEWSEGAIEAISSTAGAALAAPRGAVSADGGRIYWRAGTSLYLREGGSTVLVAEGASFQGASADGSLAFYLKAGHLRRYQVSGAVDTDLTPAGGVAALLGTSADGATLFYVAADGLYRRAGAVTSKLSSAGPASLPPSVGRAAASADGTRLFFDSSAPLLFADTNASPDVYEWEAQGVGSCAKAGGCLALVSDGRSSGAGLIDASASGTDVFFATRTALLPADPDSALDAYDAREGGGLPEAGGPACVGDDCPDPAPAPEYQIPPTATLPGLGNPPLRFKAKKRKHKHHRRHRKHRRRHHGGGGRRR